MSSFTSLSVTGCMIMISICIYCNYFLVAFLPVIIWDDSMAEAANMVYDRLLGQFHLHPSLKHVSCFISAYFLCFPTFSQLKRCHLPFPHNYLRSNKFNLILNNCVVSLVISKLYINLFNPILLVTSVI